MKTIGQFELVDHGIDHCQSFIGCGITFTSFEDIATGCGSNPAEAIDDALECLTLQAWETGGMEARILAQDFSYPHKFTSLPTEPAVSELDGGCYYYVSIRVKE
jgi:hypothetical protein